MAPGRVAVIYGVSAAMAGGEEMVSGSPAGMSDVLGMNKKIVDGVNQLISMSCRKWRAVSAKV